MTLPLRQLQTLRFIEHRLALGIPVGFVDVMEHLHVTKATAHKHLRALERKRLVEWTKYAHRALRVVKR